jgi:hypothetical protein
LALDHATAAALQDRLHLQTEANRMQILSNHPTTPIKSLSGRDTVKLLGLRSDLVSTPTSMR